MPKADDLNSFNILFNSNFFPSKTINRFNIKRSNNPFFAHVSQSNELTSHDLYILIFATHLIQSSRLEFFL